MKTKQCQFNLITILLVCVSLLSVSCGGGSGTGGGTGPGETASITLSVSTGSIPANGASSLAITANLSDSTGAAVDRGTSVEFSTTLGTFINGSATYTTSTPNESGTVTVSLIAAETEGTARITVKSNKITQTYDVAFTIQVVGSVTVTSGSPQLLADGISQTEITSTVKDTDNHNMPDGITVYFSTDFGTLSADSATITNGQATVTLTSSTQAGTATITAVAASVLASTVVTFIPGDVGIISLTATPNNLTADGQSTSTIRATVTDANGNLVADGKSISFSVIAPGGGTLSVDGAVTNLQTVSASTTNGVVTVTYMASFTALTETVRAQATNGTTAMVDIVLINQIIGSVTISAGSSEIVADGFSTTTISATIKDRSGINVRDGINVSFTATAGTLLKNTAATANGVATVTLMSPTNLGFTEVRATAGGVNATVRIDFVPGAPYRITVLAVPQTVTVSGTSNIEAVVYDRYDNPVADGETLTFRANYGTLNALTATTSGGTTSITYTAPSSVPATLNDTIRVETTNGRIGTVSITVTEPEVTSITLTANPTSIPADDASQATITATVTVSGGGDAPDGTVVSFSITSGGGSITPSATTTDGTATAVLTSGTATGMATIRAESEGISATIDVEYAPTPASLSLGLSQATVQSDNSDSSTITATVLDSNFAVIEGITVNFSSDGGQLSESSAETDDSGEATVDFSSGTTNRTNRVVTITATVSGLPESQIPVQVTGTTLTLITGATSLEIGGNDQTTLTITARDAGSVPIFNADITITSSPVGIIQISSSTGTTDVTGKLEVTLTALSTGIVTVTAQGLGATAAQNYTVGAVGAVFTITDPTEDPYSASTGDAVTVIVNAPTQAKVQFATTLGLFGDGIQTPAAVLDVDVVGGVAQADLTSTEAGTANIQVSDLNDPSTSDSLTVLFSAPSSEADNLSLQASATVVAPSTGGVSNSVSLTATVKTAGGEVVGGAPVVFTIEDPTGGGEFVTPPIAYTDSFGIAEVTFTSGSLSSDASGVTVRATIVDDPAITDSIQIIIGGTGGSVVIGISTSILSINNDTAYSVPVSVLVSDSNGNPVTGAVVTLNLWPSYYTTGCFDEIADVWGIWGCAVDPGYYPIDAADWPNEDDLWGPLADQYRNLILDPGEDVGPGPGVDQGEIPDVPNPDGLLTPPLSAAGSIPGTVSTDENGVGTFDLVYLKSSAIWITVEITASVLVSGTENQGSITRRLGWAIGDEPQLAGPSPYNYDIPGFNYPPTDIDLSTTNVDEEEPIGTTVGTLTTVDGDIGDTHTYSLVAGPGDDDNASFSIVGDVLRTAEVFNYEADDSYSIRVQTDDGMDTYEEAFTISINDVNDPPTDINLSSTDVNEGEPIGTTVGTFSTVDEDVTDIHTYSLVAGPGDTDNASFIIDSGGNLLTGAVFDYDVQNSYSIRVETNDGEGGTFEEQFTITVNDLP